MSRVRKTNPEGFTDLLKRVCAKTCEQTFEPACWRLPELVKPCEHITPCKECLALVAKPPNDRQRVILDAIDRINGWGIYCPNAQQIAGAAGLLPSIKYSLSVTSTLWALERMGRVGRIPPKDRWDKAGWCLEKLEGKIDDI